MKNLRVYAPAYTLSGYGAHSRDILSALFYSKKFNISLEHTGWGGTSISSNFTEDELSVLDFCSHNSLRATSDYIYVHICIPSEFQTPSKYNIGITAGLEATVIPQQWVDKCNAMTLIVVPSSFSKNVFITNGVTVPIFVIGEGVDTSIFNQFSNVPTSDKFAIQLNSKIHSDFNFFFAGQWGSPGMDRKQVSTLISIFQETFKNNKEVGLVLKTYISNMSTPDSYFTRHQIDSMLKYEYPKVHLIHGDIDASMMHQLYTNSKIKAFISLTSGEGWNRCAAEAVSCDLPVMLPNWSGHMDFVNDTYSTLFNTTLVPVPPAYYRTGWFTPESKWCSIIPEDVASKMLSVYKEYPSVKARATEYGVEFRKKWDIKYIYNPLIDILDEFTFTDNPVLPATQF